MVRPPREYREGELVENCLDEKSWCPDEEHSL